MSNFFLIIYTYVYERVCWCCCSAQKLDIWHEKLMLMQRVNWNSSSNVYSTLYFQIFLTFLIILSLPMLHSFFNRRKLSAPIPASFTSFEKYPWVFSSSFCGVSNSTMSPASNTMILSLSITVCSRCATVMTVQSANCLRIVVWIKLSVLKKKH